MSNIKKCFLISPMGKPDSETRLFADRVRNFLSDEIMSNLGYELMRSDDINESGMITDAMVNHIIDSELVIALLDYENANVYYELAVRHCSGKVCFLIMSDVHHEQHETPFDTRDVRTMIFSHADMLDYKAGNMTKSLLQFKGNLSKAITTYESNPYQILNPVIRARRDFKLPPNMSAENFLKLLDGKLNLFDVSLNKRFEDSEGQNERLNRIEFALNQIRPDKIMDAMYSIYEKGVATYIEGEEASFNAITEMVMRAKRALRTSHFFPKAIYDSERSFFTALCEFGRKRDIECKHIMCMNERAKIDDLWRIVASTFGGDIRVFLTQRDNNFEINVVDDTAALLSFYDDARRIKSTLLIIGKPVIREFEMIYDRILCDPFYDFFTIDCHGYKNPGEFSTVIDAVINKFGIPK